MMKFCPLEKTIIIFCLLLIIAHFVASFFPEQRLWGINHLAYFPLYSRITIVFLGLLLFIFILNSRILIFFKDKVNSSLFWWIKKHKYLGYIIVSVIFLVIFWLLRTRTCLLGDGYLRAYEVSIGVKPWFTEFLDMYVHTILYHFFHQIFNWDAYRTYASVSCVCGAIFVFFVFLLCDLVGKHTIDKVLIFALLILSGGSQLFLGYVESYTIVYLGILIFIYFSIGYLNGKNGLILPCVILILSVFFHLSAVYLFPSFLFLLLTKDPNQKPANTKRIASQKFFCIILIAISAILGFYLFKFYLIKESGEKLSYFLIPLIGSKENPYSLFSFSHLLDVINQQFLISPVGIGIWAAILLCLRKRLNFKSATSEFFLLVTLFSLGFALLIDPELGYARDWDLFASTALGYTIWGAYLVVNFLKESKKAKYVLFAVTLVLLISSIPWFLINAEMSKSVRRFENLLGLYQRGKAYGHETLAYFYGEQGMVEKEIEELEKAIALEKKPRNIAKLGERYSQIGKVDKGISLLKTAIQIDPNDAIAHNSLGVLYFNKGLFEEATLEFKKAIGLRPSYSLHYKNLGYTLFKIGLIEEAIEQYNTAKKLEPQNPSIHYWLGVSYAEKGLFNEAIKSFKKSLELKPDFAEAYRDLGATYFKMDKTDEAILFFEKALRIKPDYALAHYGLGLALAKKGLNQKATEHLQLYLNLSKDTTGEEEIRSLIEKLKDK